MHSTYFQEAGFLPSKQTLGRTSGLKRKKKKKFASQVATLASLFSQNRKTVVAYTTKGKTTPTTAACDCDRKYFKM